MRRIKFIISDAIYNLRTRIQRFRRGYSYSDVWDIDMWFMEMMKPMLIHLRDHGWGYPFEFKDREEWEAILTEMVNCLQLMNEDGVEESMGFAGENALKMKSEDYKKAYEIMCENKNRFFELFSKYFYSLWD